MASESISNATSKATSTAINTATSVAKAKMEMHGLLLNDELTMLVTCDGRKVVVAVGGRVISSCPIEDAPFRVECRMTIVPETEEPDAGEERA